MRLPAPGRLALEGQADDKSDGQDGPRRAVKKLGKCSDGISPLVSQRESRSGIHHFRPCSAELGVGGNSGRDFQIYALVLCDTGPSIQSCFQGFRKDFQLRTVLLPEPRRDQTAPRHQITTAAAIKSE